MEDFKYEEVLLDEQMCAMFASLVQQDTVNVKVLFFIAHCEQQGKLVTVKTITDNVLVKRKKGLKDAENKLVSFSTIEGEIDRKTAERIVDRLAYASLIYFDVQLPTKFIRLTKRGVQVAMLIHQQLRRNSL